MSYEAQGCWLDPFPLPPIVRFDKAATSTAVELQENTGELVCGHVRLYIADPQQISWGTVHGAQL